MKHRRQTPDIIADLMGDTPNNKTSDQDNNTAIKPTHLKAAKQEGNRQTIPASNKASKPASKKKVKPASPKALTQVDCRTIKPQSNKASEQESNTALHGLLKDKATFNLSKQLLESLDDAWIMLRRAKKKDQRITKTLIVEVALQLALNDLQEKGENSPLYRHLTTE